MTKPVVWIGLIFSLLFWARVGHSAEISEPVAVHAILGEARGEGYRGMYAVACAIRNRGTLRGVYGARAFMPDVTPADHQRAAKAWAESDGGVDVTKGATHWENVDAFGKPSWAKKMTCTAVIGHHRFYK